VPVLLPSFIQVHKLCWNEAAYLCDSRMNVSKYWAFYCQYVTLYYNIGCLCVGPVEHHVNADI
jgi:hypothetical protein